MQRPCCYTTGANLCVPHSRKALSAALSLSSLLLTTHRVSETLHTSLTTEAACLSLSLPPQQLLLFSAPLACGRGVTFDRLPSLPHFRPPRHCLITATAAPSTFSTIKFGLFLHYDYEATLDALIFCIVRPYVSIPQFECWPLGRAAVHYGRVLVVVVVVARLHTLVRLIYRASSATARRAPTLRQLSVTRRRTWIPSQPLSSHSVVIAARLQPLVAAFVHVSGRYQGCTHCHREAHSSAHTVRRWAGRRTATRYVRRISRSPLTAASATVRLRRLLSAHRLQSVRSPAATALRGADQPQRHQRQPIASSALLDVVGRTKRTVHPFDLLRVYSALRDSVGVRL